MNILQYGNKDPFILSTSEIRNIIVIPPQTIKYVKRKVENIEIDQVIQQKKVVNNQMNIDIQDSEDEEIEIIDNQDSNKHIADNKSIHLKGIEYSLDTDDVYYEFKYNNKYYYNFANEKKLIRIKGINKLNNMYFVIYPNDIDKRGKSEWINGRFIEPIESRHFGLGNR